MNESIVVSGFLVRFPLGGHVWHHFQYLVGLARLGYRLTYVEDYGWPDSCYDPSRDAMSADATYGIAFLRRLLEPHGLDASWCYLAENGTTHGMERETLRRKCMEAELYLNLSNVNEIPETELCHRRALIDTDPVFTQIGAHGISADLTEYDALFTYGANVHRAGSTMPDAGLHWMSTRQPVVPDLWPVTPSPLAGSFTTVMNWSAYGDHEHQGQVYGQKDREFEPYFSLPNETGVPMEIAVAPPDDARQRLVAGGWTVRDPRRVAKTPQRYQHFLRRSRGEFSVAKHAYVVTHSGWFSDRSAGYLASGRPVLVQETGFSDWLPTGTGVVPFSTRAEAVEGIADIATRYTEHCTGAREIAQEYFGADRVLRDLLERAGRSS